MPSRWPLLKWVVRSDVTNVENNILSSSLLEKVYGHGNNVKVDNDA